MQGVQGKQKAAYMAANSPLASAAEPGAKGSLKGRRITMFRISLIEVLFWIIFAWLELFVSDDASGSMISSFLDKILGYRAKRSAVSLMFVAVCFPVRLVFGIRIMLAVFALLVLQLYLAVNLQRFFKSIEIK